MPQISPLAVVEAGAELADDVVVGAFSYLGPEVRVAAGCIIENNVTLTGRTTLGERNHLFPMCVVGARPDDVPTPGNCPIDGECVLAEANTVREHAVIFAGLEQPTRIGRDNLLMIGCQIGAGAEVGNHEILANYTHVQAAAVIEDYVRASAFGVIEPGVRVGEYSFIAAYTRIDRDAPPFAMLQGTPYRVRGVNTHNLHRCGFGDDDIRALKRVFRDVYNGASGAVDAEVIAAILADPTVAPPVRRVAEVIHRSLDAKDPADG